MTGQPIITIRWHVTQTGRRGYRWTCHVCDVGGMHRFDWWTDWVRRRHPDAHPWRRCIDAADRHVCRAHRDLAEQRTTP